MNEREVGRNHEQGGGAKDNRRQIPEGTRPDSERVYEKNVGRQDTRRLTGGYTLHRLLGKGSFGAVYLGEEEFNGSPVAVKVFNPEVSVEEARIEARAQMRLQPHRNIVPIRWFDVHTDTDEHGMPQESPFIVMNYVSGGSLVDHIKRKGRLSVPESVHIIGQAVDGVARAHEEKVLHRDLKPGNLLIDDSDPAPDVALSDFGIAIKAHTGDYIFTQQTPIGTAQYIAPEQIDGEAVYASDQYALGTITYELLTGRWPFIKDTAINYLIAHKTETPPSFEDAVSKGRMTRELASLEEVVMKAMAKDKKARYPSVGDYGEALRHAAGIRTKDETIIDLKIREARVNEEEQRIQRLREGFEARARGLDGRETAVLDLERRVEGDAAQNAEQKRELDEHLDDAVAKILKRKAREYIRKTLRRSDPLERLMLIDIALTLDPENAIGYAERANELSMLNREEEALKAYDKVIELKPEAAQPYHRKGCLFLRMGRNQEAVCIFDKAILDEAIELTSAQEKIFYKGKGVALFELERYEEAIEAYDQALLGPKFGEAFDSEMYANQAHALEKLGRMKESEEMLAKARELEAKATGPLMVYSDVFRESFEERLALCNEILLSDPEDSYTHYEKGNFLSRNGRKEEALRCVDNAIKLDPVFTYAYCARGDILIDLGRYEEAMSSFDNAISLSPDDPNPYYEKSLALKKIGRTDEAKEMWDKARELEADQKKS